MSGLDLAVSGALAAIGSWFLYVFLKTLLAPAFFWYSGSRGLFRFRKYSVRLERADELLKENKFLEALQELRKAPFIEVVTNPALVSAIREHNRGVLSRCAIISDALGTKTENIAIVDSLLQERWELLSMHSKSHQAYMKIKLKRKEIGKETPQWTKEEFDKKRKEISDELDRNYKDLAVSLRHLFDTVENSRKESILYH